MILDDRLEFADALNVFAAAGTAVVGDQIDLRQTSLLAGTELLDTLYLVVQVTTAFVGATATVDFRLTSADNGAITTNPTDHWTSGAIPVASLVVGARWIIPLPRAAYRRFLGIRVVTATATTTAGAIDAFLTNDVQNWRAYADAVN
jgi:hypothetical protein